MFYWVVCIMMKKVIILSSLLSFQIADLHAMKGKSEYIGDAPSMPKRALTALKCSRLPDGQEESRWIIRHPQKAAMNLAPLYERGLSGHGQTLGLIEGGKIEADYPGLEGAIHSNSIISGKNESHISHACSVAQTAVSSATRFLSLDLSSAEYVGIAPNSGVLFGNRHFVQDGLTIENFRDAIAQQILKGATCINLSIHVKNEGTPESSFMDGIRYALREHVPVFLSAGNDKEEIGIDPYLKKITWAFGENPLFTLCVGYTWDSFVDRKDIRFAKNSGRGNKNYPKESLSVLAAPYDADVLKPSEFSSNIEWASEKAKGTSLSAPATAGAYLLLAEYADSIKADRGVKISAKDIMYCLKKGTYKPEPREDEDVFWYGGGCVDGAAALDLLEKVVSARTLYKEKEFTQSAALWQEIIETFGPQSPEKYVISAIQAQMESGEGLDDYLRKIIGLVEENYAPNYVETIVEAYRLFQAEDYENARGECLDEAEDEMKDLYCRANNLNPDETLVELKHGLHHFINLKTRPGSLALRSAEIKFKRWEMSFLDAERKLYKNAGELIPLDLHAGDRILENLLGVYEKFDESQLGEDMSVFRWSLKSTIKDLKAFAIPQETMERIARIEHKLES